MMDASVPILISLWFGIGTVTVLPIISFCMTMWLPRLRICLKPFDSRIRETSRPDRVLSLANGHFHLGYIDLLVQPLFDFLWRRGLKEEL